MKESRYEIKKQELMELLGKRKFAGNKLPTEEQLSVMLNTSKGTVREILRELEQAGYVSKKHGLGNFVHPSAFNTRMRFEVLLEFTALIRDGGYQPSIKAVPVRKGEADELVQGFLQGADGQALTDTLADVLFVKRLYMADDKPAILSKICLPKQIITTEIPEDEVVGSLYRFINKYCGQELEQSIIHFVPRQVTAEDVKLLKAKDERALFVLHQIFYSIYDDAVCAIENIFNLEVLPLTMLRK